MSANADSSVPPAAAARWRLWVDGCGGFLLLTGQRWTLGGSGHDAEIDVGVRADWPRLAGAIEREGGDYFWASHDATQPRRLVHHGGTLPIAGSATAVLTVPNPLSASALLRLQPPHRFDDHVDGVIFVHQNLLVGPALDNHIRCDHARGRTVVVYRDDQWWARTGTSDEFQPLCPGRRLSLENLAMTLELG